MKKGGLCGEGGFSASEDILTLLGQLWWNFWGFLPNAVDTELSYSGSCGVSARKAQSEV